MYQFDICNNFIELENFVTLNVSVNSVTAGIYVHPNISTCNLSSIWLDPNRHNVVSVYIRFIISFII